MNRLVHATRSARRALAVGSAAALAVALVTGCTPRDGAEAETDSGAAQATSAAATAPDNAGKSADEVLADNLPYTETAALVGQTWDQSSEVPITLAGTSATAGGDGVAVDGDTVTITAPGTYRLSGTLAGQVVVDSASDGVVRLLLDGVDVTSSTTSALAITDADQVSIVLADGSSNTLTDATQYDETDEDNAPNAALFSTADLAISGGGTLTVTGRMNDGIGAKDGLVIDADVHVTAVDDGVRGKDYLVVAGGTLTVEAGGDGLKSDEDEDLTAGYVLVHADEVSITAGVDGIDAATDVVITGGTLTVAADDDGVHAEHALVIADGKVTVTRSEEGLEGLDITLTGGTIDVTAADDGINASDGSGSTGNPGVGDPASGGTRPERGTPPGGGTVPEATSTADDAAAAPSAPPDLPDSGTLPGDTAAPDPATAPDGEAVGGPAGGPPGGAAPGDAAADGTAGGTAAGGGGTTSAASLTISGGTLRVDADGDGLDSNGMITMTGGDVVVHGPTNDGNGALDTAAGFTIDGGTLVAVGSAGMAETPATSSAQGWLAARFDTALAAGTTLTVAGPDGTELASLTLEKQAASLVLSTPDVTTGEAYSVSADDGTQVTATAGQAIAGGLGPQ